MEDLNETRVPQIRSKEELSSEDQHHYEFIDSSRGGVRGPFKVLLNSPETAGKVAKLGAYLRYDSVLDEQIRELVILTTARESECAYEWAAHEPIAREKGANPDAIEIISSRDPTDELSPVESRAITYVRELIRENEVSESTYEAVSGRLGAGGMTELTATIGYYALLAHILNAFEVIPGDDASAYQ